jgi:predicted amidohydrolase
MKPACVGIVQMDTEDRKERNLKKASALIEEAVAKGAEIVGFRSY